MNLIFYNNLLVVQMVSESQYVLPAILDLCDMNITRYGNNLSQVDGLFRLNLNVNEELNGKFQLINFRQILNFFPESLSHKIIYHQQLLHYFVQHQYCGQCGESTKINANNIVCCGHCNCEVYPRISPAIIVRIRRGSEILLARGVGFAAGVWGLIAGYVEIGESLEQTVHREVMEEVGIKIDNVCYWGSQYWPMPNSLMVGFTAECVSGELKIDHVELEDAGFYEKHNLPGMPSTKYSLASRMIHDFFDKI